MVAWVLYRWTRKEITFPPFPREKQGKFQREGSRGGGGGINRVGFSPIGMGRDARAHVCRSTPGPMLRKKSFPCASELQGRAGLRHCHRGRDFSGPLLVRTGVGCHGCSQGSSHAACIRPRIWRQSELTRHWSSAGKDRTEEPPWAGRCSLTTEGQVAMQPNHPEGRSPCTSTKPGKPRNGSWIPALSTPGPCRIGKLAVRWSPTLQHPAPDRACRVWRSRQLTSKTASLLVHKRPRVASCYRGSLGNAVVGSLTSGTCSKLVGSTRGLHLDESAIRPLQRRKTAVGPFRVSQPQYPHHPVLLTSRDSSYKKA